MSATILVVDDDQDILQLVSTRLQLAGYVTFTANSGEEGLRQFFARRPDLSLVDIDMPGMGGITLCQRLREVSDSPVIFLTAMGGEADKVRGLRAGADDYIVKPFSKEELLARIEAVLRRSRSSAEKKDDSIYSDGVVDIDQRAHVVTVRGRQLNLSPLEYRVLVTLVRNAGFVLSQDQILNNAWGEDADEASPDSVRLYVSYLRAKIELDPKRPRLIETVREFGYRYARPKATESTIAA